MEAKLKEILSRFDLGKTIKLTEEEELVILKYLMYHDEYPVGNGSSRVVYALDDYVVKVAMSTGGLNQHAVERDFYERYSKAGCFAHLFAYGKTINVMEFLAECDFYDYLDEGWYDDEDKEKYEAISAAIATADEVTDYDGGDNCQVGYSIMQNAWVLYDYGYSLDYERNDLVDDVGSWMDVVDPIENAIRMMETGEVFDYGELSRMVDDFYAEEEEEN